MRQKGMMKMLALGLVLMSTPIASLAGRVEQQQAYQACAADVSGCTELYLGSASLTGTVPTEIALLTSLTRMAVDDNQLTGSLPTELALMPGLADMSVCDNAGLCGDVPAGVNLYSFYGYCAAGPTSGTLLGSPCQSPSPPPTAIPSPPPSPPPPALRMSTPLMATPTTGEHPLRDNWFRKRDLARQKAFPQYYSWLRKQAKKRAARNIGN
eukprot:CAMPEP_0114292406 /NCGR_PEP_ID=MMETSP0059-20121206/9045_1 /TAXON_ID=36894 /ORGANISM="Pyramimonas parkeae, Strain CCMP726" /LENGTH=210 /DNA_ID=CAMNT_0001414053 /DNA_START=168 /DNA_END=800 /DNA_ORIENTATION=-